MMRNGTITEQSMSVLTIKNLSIAFGKEASLTRVVSDLNVTIEAGQCMGLVGESGSGKSLTALSIMQLLPPTASIDQRSQILLHDENLLDYSERAMRRVRGFRIGMIFQDAMSALNPVFTIGQQMNEILGRYVKARQKKTSALTLLQEVGMAE